MRHCELTVVSADADPYGETGAARTRVSVTELGAATAMQSALAAAAVSSPADGEAAFSSALALARASPHPRLWRALCRAALERHELTVAHAAVEALGDTAGAALLRRVREHADPRLQAAELAAHFGRVAEAGAAFAAAGRPDLAAGLAASARDWDALLRLATKVPTTGLDGGAGDAGDRPYGAATTLALLRARLSAAPPPGDPQAAPGGGQATLVEALLVGQRFDALEALAGGLPAGAPLLRRVGEGLQAAGRAAGAAAAFARAGDPAAAVGACVALQQWALAAQLAETHGLGPQLRRVAGT